MDEGDCMHVQVRVCTGVSVSVSVSVSVQGVNEGVCWLTWILVPSVGL